MFINQTGANILFCCTGFKRPQFVAKKDIADGGAAFAMEN